eukprot:COSAG01_NODE_5754_length_4054_cov_28.824526_9_plen_86_part_00
MLQRTTEIISHFLTLNPNLIFYIVSVAFAKIMYELDLTNFVASVELPNMEPSNDRFPGHYNSFGAQPVLLKYGCAETIGGLTDHS